MTGLRDGDWRRQRLADARLYLCSDLRLERSDLIRFLDAALAGGVDIIQLRHKEPVDDDVLRMGAEVFAEAAIRHDALFIVNDDPQLAVAFGADGVHVGQDDAHPRDARRVVGDQLLIGRSTHSLDEVTRAQHEDCDYVAVGPVHETPTKEGRPGIGLGPVRLAATISRKPWFVTGGMSTETAPAVLAAGATGIVVVRAIAETDDPQAAAAALASLVRP